MGTMDLADIDFDDDDGFGQEIDNNNSKSEAKQSVASQPMVTQARYVHNSTSQAMVTDVLKQLATRK